MLAKIAFQHSVHRVSAVLVSRELAVRLGGRQGDPVRTWRDCRVEPKRAAPLALVGPDFADVAVWIGGCVFAASIALLYRWAAHLERAVGYSFPIEPPAPHGGLDKRAPFNNSSYTYYY
ncbi:MAG: hypothetical protein KGJ55_11970 [Gammaproteobacteria bacterium]|nr:hypothetical protein [Gammaproteobacteria bacterium]